MLKFKTNIRIRSEAAAFSVNEQRDRIDEPVPSELVFDSATDSLSTTTVVNNAAELTRACNRALGRQLIYWGCFLIIIVAVGDLMLRLSYWFAILAAIAGFFMSDDLWNLPDGLYVDPSGNVVVKQGSYIATPGGSIVQMHTNV